MSQAENPYSSPQEISAAPIIVNRRRITPFASGHFLAMCAVAMFVVGILGEFAILASNWSQYELLAGAQQGHRVTREVVEANEARQQMLNMGIVGIRLLTAIVFLMWVHRAHRNLPSLGVTHLEFTPASAVWWWFVPIASLVNPYLAMREIARGSDPDAGNARDAVYRPPQNLPLLPWWWAGFLTMIFCGIVLRLLTSHIANIDDALNVTMAYMIRNVVSVAASILAIFVVLGIDGRQEEKYRRICELPPSTPDSHGPGSPDQVSGFLDSLD